MTSAVPAPRRLAEMTSEQAASYLERDDRLLFPFGSTEQNGPHLPLGSDALLATAVAERASAATGVVVAPTLPFGTAPADLPFAGTLSVDAHVLGSVLVDVCRSVARHGFRRVVVLSGHLNNVWTVASVSGAISALGLVLAQVDLWRLLERLCGDLARTSELPFGHGSEMMTSVLLALRPELVDRRRQVRGEPIAGWGVDSFRSYPDVMGFAPWDQVSSIGTVGDPSHADATVGETALQRVTERVVELLNDIRTAPLPMSPDGVGS
jgi:creatinine amidohydrolase